MICKNCGKEIADNSLFCNYCGNATQEDNQEYCPECGTAVDGDSSFCGECGYELSENRDSRKEDWDDILADYGKPNIRRRSSGQKRKEKKHSGTVKITVIAVAIAVLLAAGILICIKSGLIGNLSDDSNKASALEDSSYYPLYLNILEENNFGDEELSTYYLYDMDGDGVKELIVRGLTCEADARFTFYSVDNSGISPQAVKVGTETAGNTAIFGIKDDKGIIAQYAHMGYEKVDEIKLDKGKLIKSNLIKGHEKEDGYTVKDNWLELDARQITDLEPLGGKSQKIDKSDSEEDRDSKLTDEYILPDSDSRYITADDLDGLGKWRTMIALNEIYARKGRIFTDSEIREYFEAQDWYSPTVKPEDFSMSSLNKYENRNIGTIIKYQEDQGWRKIAPEKTVKKETGE